MLLKDARDQPMTMTRSARFRQGRLGSGLENERKRLGHYDIM